MIEGSSSSVFEQRKKFDKDPEEDKNDEQRKQVENLD